MKKKIFFLPCFFLLLSLFLPGCRRGPAVSFPSETAFFAEAILSDTPVRAEVRLSASGGSRFVILYPASLAGTAFIRREDGRVFAERDGQIVPLPGGHPFFSSADCFMGAAGGSLSPVRNGDGWLLRGETPEGDCCALFSSSGELLGFSGPGFSLTVKERLP